VSVCEGLVTHHGDEGPNKLDPAKEELREHISLVSNTGEVEAQH